METKDFVRLINAVAEGQQPSANGIEENIVAAIVRLYKTAWSEGYNKAVEGNKAVDKATVETAVKAAVADAEEDFNATLDNVKFDYEERLWKADNDRKEAVEALKKALSLLDKD